MKLRKVEEYVTKILEENKKARKSDYVLYAEVLKKFNFSGDIYLYDFLYNYTTKWQIPSFKTVERARRKVQGERPELKDKIVDDLRFEQQKDYIEYALDTDLIE